MEEAIMTTGVEVAAIGMNLDEVMEAEVVVAAVEVAEVEDEAVAEEEVAEKADSTSQKLT